MEIYLIRHTTPQIEKGVCYGQSDIPLNLDLFETELEKIVSALPKNIDHVYSSPLKRCAVLANKLSQNVILNSDLMELNFGDWELQKWVDLTSTDFMAWMDDFVNLPTQNGESYLDLHLRTKRFLDLLLQQKHHTIAVVCHAGNIRSIISYLLDLPLNNSFRLHLNHGAVVQVALFENKNFNKLISISN